MPLPKVSKAGGRVGRHGRGRRPRRGQRHAAGRDGQLDVAARARRRRAPLPRHHAGDLHVVCARARSVSAPGTAPGALGSRLGGLPPGRQVSASSPVRTTVMERGMAPMARHCTRSCTRTCARARVSRAPRAPLCRRAARAHLLVVGDHGHALHRLEGHAAAAARRGAGLRHGQRRRAHVQVGLHEEPAGSGGVGAPRRAAAAHCARAARRACAGSGRTRTGAATPASARRRRGRRCRPPAGRLGRLHGGRPAQRPRSGGRTVTSCSACEQRMRPMLGMAPAAPASRYCGRLARRTCTRCLTTGPACRMRASGRRAASAAPRGPAGAAPRRRRPRARRAAAAPLGRPPPRRSAGAAPRAAAPAARRRARR